MRYLFIHHSALSLVLQDEKKQTNKMNLKAALEKAKSASPERSDGELKLQFLDCTMSCIIPMRESKIHVHVHCTCY